MLHYEGDNATIARHKAGPTSNFEPVEQFLKANRLELDLTYMLNGADGEPFITRRELDNISETVIGARRKLASEEGDCRDGETAMLGWQSLPDRLSREHLDQVCQAARELTQRIDAFVSLGIGGSYLGIEATFRALSHTWFNQLSRDQRGGLPEIYFLGQNTDPDMFRDTMDCLEGKRIGLNVISKSGTTTETALAFRVMRELLEKDAETNAQEIIVATTDASKGALRRLTDQKGYRSFVVPDNVGGRFSVLTDVGLFGLAVAGIDIHEFAAGFRHMKERTDHDDFWSNPAMVHAAVRHLSHQKGKRIEVVATNSSAVYQITRWMEQLFPESEGHRGQGLWVTPSMYSEKLHANGQMVQQGHRNLIETFLDLVESDNRVSIPRDEEDLDGLNYLAEKDMNFINRLVIEGPAWAHFQGGVPNMTIRIPMRNAFNVGQLYYMMELSVALSGYLAGINPFVQPGVEAYKKAIFGLAGKPGHEDTGGRIREQINNMDRIVV
jgi:glucose-6-phosphate isomerase